MDDHHNEVEMPLSSKGGVEAAAQFAVLDSLSLCEYPGFVGARDFVREGGYNAIRR